MKLHGFILVLVRRKYISSCGIVDFLFNKEPASYPLVGRVMVPNQRDLHWRVFHRVSPFLAWIGIKLLFWLPQLPAVALDPCSNVSTMDLLMIVGTIKVRCTSTLIHGSLLVYPGYLGCHCALRSPFLPLCTDWESLFEATSVTFTNQYIRP